MRLFEFKWNFKQHRSRDFSPLPTSEGQYYGLFRSTFWFDSNSPSQTEVDPKSNPNPKTGNPGGGNELYWGGGQISEPLPEGGKEGRG